MPESQSGLDHCPKCGAKVYLDSDHHGSYTYCLRCGFTRDVPAAGVSPKPPGAAAGNLTKLTKT